MQPLSNHPDVVCRNLQGRPSKRAQRPQVGVFARRSIRAGELVLHNAPLGYVGTSNRCFYCLTFLQEHLECSHCTAVYCSIACQTLHWDQHRVTCDTTYSLDAVLLLQAATRQGNDSDPLNPSWSNLMYLLRRGDPTVSEAEAHAMTQVCGRAADELLSAAQRMSNNNFTISTSELIPVGAAIYPFGALLNHSCLANCAAVYVFQPKQPPIQCFVALTDIPVGEQLTHNYCDLVQSRSARWQQLGFQCQCLRCQNPSNLEQQLEEIDGISIATLQHVGLLAPSQELAALESLRSSSLSSELQRWARMVTLLIEHDRLEEAHQMALRVYSLHRQCYRYRSHPALLFQARALAALDEKNLPTRQ